MARLCGVPLRRRLEAVQKVCGALGVGRGAEDGALVILQDGQPVGDIGSVVFAGRQGQL